MSTEMLLSRASVEGFDETDLIADYTGFSNILMGDVGDHFYGNGARLEGESFNNIARGLWDFLQRVDPGISKIKVFNPALSHDGWDSRHSIIMLLHPDMDHLVDSIRMALEGSGVRVHGLMSTVLSLRRNSGVLFVPGEQGESSASNASLVQSTEALIFIEIDRRNDDQLSTLERLLSAVLFDVELVANESKAIVDHLREISTEYRSLAGAVLSQDVVDECLEFFSWISSHQIILLNSGRYSERLETVCKKQEDPWEGEFPLAFYTSSLKSRVHRSAYCDLFVINRYSDDGVIIGESRFIGVNRAEVYAPVCWDIPVVRKKLSCVLAMSGLKKETHHYRMLRQSLEGMPYEDLMQTSVAELYATASEISLISERRQLRLFIREDPLGGFVHCLLYMPRDMYSSSTRKSIQSYLSKCFNAEDRDTGSCLFYSTLSRVKFVFKVNEDPVGNINIPELEENVATIAKSWTELLADCLMAEFGEEQGCQLIANYSDAFTASYRAHFTPVQAINDLKVIVNLSPANKLDVALRYQEGDDDDLLLLRIFNIDDCIELSDVVPILENMGLHVVGEHTYRLPHDKNKVVYLHDFTLKIKGRLPADIDGFHCHFKDTFSAVWQGKAENDRFNHLLLLARLSWREISILRAYARYMKQLTTPFGLGYIAETLINKPQVARDLIGLFKSRFDPMVNKQASEDTQRSSGLNEKITLLADEMANLDEDKIIRRYLALINATKRTNFYQLSANGKPKNYLSIKVAVRELTDVPEPKPLYEIYVYSPRVEGVHLRGSKVSRGGLRWSDRLQDYRTEVLGLVKAQQVKNAVIVPAGAKGGFVARQLPAGGSRQQQQKEGIECYKTFIRGLLDLTDNLVEGLAVHPLNTVCRDGDDPYMVVAADKGTARFSNLANEIAREYKFWLGDAFASGGSPGYDHKAMGITARGGWVSVERHFYSLGVNIQQQKFTVLAIGDMSGDVFGNAMLLSKNIQLVAAFNHQHIFIDPNPDAACSYHERQRLFEADHSSWSDYDLSCISEGGGVFSRSKKSICLSPEIRARLAINTQRMTPDELIHCLLKASVDLIWNGGVGSYVKAASEAHLLVGDKSNDSLRVDGAQLQCRVFGEGGNLGMTQLGRIEFCRAGGICNTDFIDNAAGVDCSDHEVNIKILLDDLVADSVMDVDQRNQLLTSMTAEVAQLVLGNNYRQTLAISMAEMRMNGRVSEFLSVIHSLEATADFDRSLEYFPSDEDILERAAVGGFLTRPELAVLISYVKDQIKTGLLATDILGEKTIASAAAGAFPACLWQQYPDKILSHRLSREIVANQLANEIVNMMGLSFIDRLMRSSGCSLSAVTRAYVAAMDIFQLEACWQAIEQEDTRLPHALQLTLKSKLSERVLRAAQWLLANRGEAIDAEREVKLFAAGVANFNHTIGALLPESTLRLWQDNCEVLERQQVPALVVEQLASPTPPYLLLGMVETSVLQTVEIVGLVAVYAVLGEKLGFTKLLNQLMDMKEKNHWQAEARDDFINHIERSMRTMAITLVLNNPLAASADDIFSDLQAKGGVAFDLWMATLSELQAISVMDYSMLSVLAKKLSSLTNDF